MARLHDVDGVTRVALSNSAAEVIDSSDDTSSSERQVRNSAPCGVGKRPSFEITMFFEKDAAAVAATPTTANGSVGATPTPTATPTASATPAAGDGTTSASTATTQPQGGATP
jgi:hypothetical protein